MRCIDCWGEFSLPKGIIQNLCPECSKPKRLGVPIIGSPIVHLGKERFRTSQARINEVKRRVILNYDKKTGTYDCGRLDERGKVQEKEPTY